MKTNNLALLKKLVSVPSSYPYENKIGEYVYALLKNEGCAVEKQFIDSKRFNVLAEKGYGEKSILLYAHLDTVGIADGWKSDPHKLTIIGDKAYGLGAWDMKGGLAANIIAFCQNDTINMKLKMAFCVDEENISQGGHKLMNSSFMKDVACVLSTEPAFQHGTSGIVTGRIGRAVYDVTITGKSEHFAFYDPSHDINTILADFISHTQKLFIKNGNKKQFVFARTIESRSIGMSLPERMNIQLDSSILPPMTHSTMLSRLTQIARTLEKKYRSYFTISITKSPRETPFLEPYTISSNNIYLKLLKQSVRTTTKKRAIPYFRSSVADENIFGAQGIATLGIGPTGGNAHGANEWIDLPSLQVLTAIVSSFISQADGL